MKLYESAMQTGLSRGMVMISATETAMPEGYRDANLAKARQLCAAMLCRVLINSQQGVGCRGWGTCDLLVGVLSNATISVNRPDDPQQGLPELEQHAVVLQLLLTGTPRHDYQLKADPDSHIIALFDHCKVKSGTTK